MSETSIPLKKATRDKVGDQGKKSESWDKLLNRLVDENIQYKNAVNLGESKDFLDILKNMCILYDVEDTSDWSNVRKGLTIFNYCCIKLGFEQITYSDWSNEIDKEIFKRHPEYLQCKEA